MEDKNLGLKLKAVYFTTVAITACYYPFLIEFFKDRNLSYMQMGICFAVLPLIGVVFQPMWGYMTDKYLNKKITLMILMACSAFSILFLVTSRSFNTVLASIVLLAFFFTSTNPVLDAVCLEVASGRDDIQFGKIRVMGSLGYAIWSVLMGMVIKYTNINMTFYIFFVMNIMNILIVRTIKYSGGTSSRRINPGYILSLFKDYRFTIFILSVILVNVAIGANSSYLGELIKQTGGDVSNIGFLWFVVAMSEVPTFYNGNKILGKYRDLRLYYLCLCFYSLRYFLDSICISWQLVIAVQVMQSVSFALYTLSALHYLNRIIPSEMITSGMTLYTALGSGLGGFIGNISGGAILEVLDTHWLYKILSLICVASLFIGLLIERKQNAQESSSISRTV